MGTVLSAEVTLWSSQDSAGPLVLLPACPERAFLQPWVGWGRSGGCWGWHRESGQSPGRRYMSAESGNCSLGRSWGVTIIFLGMRQWGGRLQSPVAVTVTVTLLFHELIKPHLGSCYFHVLIVHFGKLFQNLMTRNLLIFCLNFFLSSFVAWLSSGFCPLYLHGEQSCPFQSLEFLERLF